MGVIEKAQALIEGLIHSVKKSDKTVKPKSDRVKPPAEYEEEDRAAMTSAALRKPPQSGQKLVPDSVMNYGE